MERIAAGKPSNTLKLGVTIRDGKKIGPVERNRRGQALHANDSPSLSTRARTTVRKGLGKLGFKESSSGLATVAYRCSKSNFEKAFGTSLETVVIDDFRAREKSYFAVPAQADWTPNKQVPNLVDDVYIQSPHLHLNQRFSKDLPSPLVPQVPYHTLTPTDVSVLVNAPKAHRRGFTGRGVKVAMIDSGFAMGHPYFQERGYARQTVLASGANQSTKDGNGHGTAESANLLAIAPDVEFIGVKLDNETSPGSGASMLEGFHEAMNHGPQIISVSLGIDLRNQGAPLPFLPNNLVALETEIRSIVASGVTVVFSAGNGHISFPGMMPDVISAGGVFIDPFGTMEASDYASAFASQVYNGRDVPDFCGLVGRSANGAKYIGLPLPSHSQIDVRGAMLDGTQPNDGYAVISGTSAAAPQIAGACAVLLSAHASLSPADLKNALSASARRVSLGSASPASNPTGTPMRGTDATGAGLIDVDAALDII